MLRRAYRQLNSFVSEQRLPSAARFQRRLDRLKPVLRAPLQDVAALTLEWLSRAQECSRSKDGGVARHYSLIDGWSTSYPETTGYIVPTFIEAGRRTNNTELLHRARRMLDWLVSIQFPEGGFQGGLIDSLPRVPVTFNTGQILIGLAAGARAFGDPYIEPMHRAAQWLVDSLDEDGCWRRFPTPFAQQGEKAYETHVSWGLLEAARVSGNTIYGDAAIRQIYWAMTKQRANAFVDDCCLTDPSQPLTHTLGYYLRGLIEGYTYSEDTTILIAARRLAERLLLALRPDGTLPGRLNDSFEPAAPWICLTGTAQIAHCWLLLNQITGEHIYYLAAEAALRNVAATISLEGDENVIGAVKGSHPVNGGYCTNQYPNWASKFFVDAAQLLHQVHLDHKDHTSFSKQLSAVSTPR